jgi:hypothetical protein
MSIAIQIAGWSGAAVLLAAYALTSWHKLASDGSAFQIMNISGAAGIALHSGDRGAWASALLNLVWIAVGLAAIVNRRRRQHRSAQPSRRP